MKDFWEILSLSGVPAWAKATTMFVLIGVFIIDRIGGVAAKLAGVTYTRQAQFVAQLEARLLQVDSELKYERERATHEAASRHIADERMHAALHRVSVLSSQLRNTRTALVNATKGKQK